MMKSPGPRRKKALIIAPTRELAVQIEGEAELLGKHLSLVIGCFLGGVGYDKQLALAKKGVDVAIGTPGRLLDFSRRGSLKFKDFGTLVIDEADRLFDMGFLPDIKALISMLPPRTARQSMLFSATLDRRSRRIAQSHMNEPEYIELTPDHLTVDTVTQKLYAVKSHIKPNLLLGILRREDPRSALIFTNQRHQAASLARTLQRNGFDTHYLSGDLAQSQRLKIINDFMAGKFPVLVATDVAARGLHIEDLDLVVNYDLPEDAESYVHRIGRTARMGKTGMAISLACEKFGEHALAIERLIGMKIPVEEPSMDMYETDLGYEARPPRSRDGRGPGGGGRRSSGSGRGRGGRSGRR
jgi:ATP-dependent RNA helicase RhlB